MPRARSRGDRDSAYLMDALLGQPRRTAAGIIARAIWRWRTELAASAGVLTVTGWLIHVLAATLAALVLTGAGTAAGVIPATRRYLARRFWCLVTRHRLQRLCWEARLHTRTGLLPLILRITPTEVGERAWVWCRAGICAEDFEDRTEEIRSACYARDARVTRDQQRSQVITIDVIRRDTLHAGRHVSPRIIPGTVLDRAPGATGNTGVRTLAGRFLASIPRWLRRTPARS